MNIFCQNLIYLVFNEYLKVADLPICLEKIWKISPKCKTSI